jgi:3-isopropylmalate/(R)-2-methylmalate dehydratase small subunit
MKMTTIQGKIWKFGDNIDTDIIIPANRLVLPLDKMKNYAMSPIEPGFAGQVNKGDIIVAGRNFGCGSSREQAPSVLKALGIQAIIAKSFARIFFRNAINLGLHVIECADIYDNVMQGMYVKISTMDGTIHVSETGCTFTGTLLPDFLLGIMQAGGLIPYLKSQLKTEFR